MKITRDGKEIGLTPAEIMSAWDEKQLEYDRYDIKVVCRCYKLELSDAEKMKHCKFIVVHEIILKAGGIMHKKRVKL